jgi:hypothetical protein
MQSCKDWMHGHWDLFVEAVKAVDISNTSEEQKEMLIRELKRLTIHSEVRRELGMLNIHLRL